jgi:hypothetical protein
MRYDSSDNFSARLKKEKTGSMGKITETEELSSAGELLRG